MHPGAPSVCRICACALALSVACGASGTPDGAVADDGGGEAAPILVEAATYCQTGYRGAGDYLVLRHLGYPDVRLYDGSWVEWGGRADLPKEK